MTRFALDTSVVVPLLVRTHDDHVVVRRWRAGRALHLTAHSVAEAYSVLTRLPGDARLAPEHAAELLAATFVATLIPDPATMTALPRWLAGAGVSGGATYDALVALAARDHNAVLATRDARALQTYRALGVDVEIVG